MTSVVESSGNATWGRGDLSRLWKSRSKQRDRRSARYEVLEGRCLLADSQVVISEFMAVNATTMADEDGEFSDWIELYNASPGGPVDLSGWYLTDNPDELRKWPLPTTSLEFNDYLLIFASGKNRHADGPLGELHTNFKLRGTGEYLALVDPSGSVVHDVGPEYPPQVADASYGTDFNIRSEQLVTPGQNARLFIPDAEDDINLGRRWTEREFDDASDMGWVETTAAVGFDTQASSAAPDLRHQLDRLISYWDFDSLVGGAVPDQVLNSKHVGHLRGGATLTSGHQGYGESGEAASLSDGGYIEIGEATSYDFNDSFTWYARVKTADTAGKIIARSPSSGKWNDGSKGLIIRKQFKVIDGRRRAVSTVGWESGGVKRVDSDASIDDTWQQIIVTFDAPTDALKIYVDGTIALDTIHDANAFDEHRHLSQESLAGSGLAIGSVSGGSIRATDNLEGLFDEIAIWDTAFDEADVALLISGASPLPDVGLLPLINSDISHDLQGRNASAYLRIPVHVDEGTFNDNETLTLRVNYDDGFVAYLNGVEIARRNVPDGEPKFDTVAASQRAPHEPFQAQSIDVSSFLNQLRPGRNILAIQAINATPDDGTMLLRSELVATSLPHFSTGVMPLRSASPGKPNELTYQSVVALPVVSAQRGLYDAPIDVAMRGETPDTIIRYTTDGTIPTPSNGKTYQTPVRVEQTTTLRVRAFRDGEQASSVATHSYLFLGDVAHQSEQAAIQAGFPEQWKDKPSDYGMDPDVVGPNDLFDGVYREEIEASLMSLPAMSVVMDLDDLLEPEGLYVNPRGEGRFWERPASVELIYPDGTEGFQQDAGLRMHGGGSRSESVKKHSLRLAFREIYGASELRTSLLGEHQPDRINSLVLRAESNDSWGRASGLMIRDRWHRQTHTAMGRVATRGILVHLYLNGQYWGVYNPVPRIDSTFVADRLGGEPGDWDVLNHRGVVDGDDEAWEAMIQLAGEVVNAPTPDAQWEIYQRLQGNHPDGSDDPHVEALLDVENMIDYLQVVFYGTNWDWPGNNWYAARRRGPDSEGFQFFLWDSDAGMNSGNGLVFNNTGVQDGVARAYGVLRNYEEFRVQFSDQVQQHFFDGGVFDVDPDLPDWDPASPERNQPAARFVSAAEQIRIATVAESARWGDTTLAVPKTRNEQWQAELDRLLKEFFPHRSAIVLQQFRDRGLFSTLDVPKFTRNDATDAAASTITMSSRDASIYYTVDGTDPRLVGGEVNPMATMYDASLLLERPTIIQARAYDGEAWSALTDLTVVINQQPADATNLRVSEIHFNPADPQTAIGELDADNDDFEFVELTNIGNQTIDLQGVSFVRTDVDTDSQGISFRFGRQYLDPDKSIVLVRDRVAFASRYGDQIPVGGEYAGRLANGGERLTLLDATDAVIQQFDFSDDWYPETDGDGSSLQVLATLVAPRRAWGNRSTWRASPEHGGTPGKPLVTGDANSDGVFDTFDLVHVFQLGKYEDDVTGNTSFEEGDWDGDGDFTSEDIVLAFRTGRFVWN